MIRAFSIWKKTLNKLSVDTRRARLKEFAALAVREGEVLDVIKSLLDDGYGAIVYAGEFYYFVRLYSIERNIETPDVSELSNAYLDVVKKKIFRLIASFLFELDIKTKCSAMNAYLNGFGTKTRLLPKVKREYQTNLFCEEILPFLCFTETSDMLFDILYVFYRVKEAYSYNFYKIIGAWVKLNGSTRGPVTYSGKKSLLSVVHHLIIERNFTCLNRIHFIFPTLSENDLYGQPFIEFIQSVPQEVLDDPNAAVYFLNSFKRAYSNGEKAYKEWLKLFENASYADENWFETLSYLEHVNINPNILSDPKYKPQHKKEVSPVNKTDYEVLDIFAKVLEEKPQYVLEFLRNISSINVFEYHNSPQSYSENIKNPLKRLYLSKSFMVDFEKRLLEYYSIRDFFRIYINSPLHEVSRVDKLLNRLSLSGIEIDISKTPLSQVMYLGKMIRKDDELFFRCPKISEYDLKITNYTLINESDSEIIESLQNFKNCKIVSFLGAISPYESVGLVGVSIVEDEVDISFEESIKYIKKKMRDAKTHITNIYFDYIKNKHFDAKGFTESVNFIENSPRIYEYQNDEWRTSLCIAQTQAFVSAAKNEDDLLEIMELTNKSWNGMLNLFAYDPFGQNTVRLSHIEYKKVLDAILDGSIMKLFNQLGDDKVSARSLYIVYFNSIIKRIMSFEYFYRLLEIKSKHMRFENDASVDDIRNYIFVGKITSYDKEKELGYLEPVSFNHGKTKFLFRYNRYIVFNQDYFFTIDRFDHNTNTCQIREVSTKAELLKYLPEEAFRSALKAYIEGAKYFSNEDISKLINSKKISGLFDEEWYDYAIHEFLTFAISEKRDLVDAIRTLGINNAFLYKTEFLRRKTKLGDDDANVYKRYIEYSLGRKRPDTINELIYIFMNSPMRMLIKLDYLIEEYMKNNDNISNLITVLMSYMIEIEIVNDVVAFSSILCEKYHFAEKRETGKYFIGDYDIHSKSVILRKCEDVDL